MVSRRYGGTGGVRPASSFVAFGAKADTLQRASSSAFASLSSNELGGEGGEPAGKYTTLQRYNVTAYDLYHRLENTNAQCIHEERTSQGNG